jgi:hypothetical protein
MDVHQQIELGDGGVDEARVQADAGVVDQEVEVLAIKMAA